MIIEVKSDVSPKERERERERESELSRVVLITASGSQCLDVTLRANTLRNIDIFMRSTFHNTCNQQGKLENHVAVSLASTKKSSSSDESTLIGLKKSSHKAKPGVGQKKNSC